MSQFFLFLKSNPIFIVMLVHAVCLAACAIANHRNYLKNNVAGISACQQWYKRINMVGNSIYIVYFVGTWFFPNLPEYLKNPWFVVFSIEVIGFLICCGGMDINVNKNDLPRVAAWHRYAGYVAYIMAFTVIVYVVIGAFGIQF